MPQPATPIVAANDALSLVPEPQSQGNIVVERFQNSPGEGNCHFEAEHTLFMFLAPRPIHYLQRQDGKTHTGLYRQGDVSLAPADTPFFARWDGEEQIVRIRLAKGFVQRVAAETLEHDGDRLTLQPEFQSRNAQLEAIATLLLAETHPTPSSSALYLDSLAHVLAVNLLRHHATTHPQVPRYEGGLLPRQLNPVLDYIDTYLHDDIKLVDLAQLLNMSPFHFSRLFKQSTGLSPHQYLIQQRVERAKWLLKHSDRPIIDIALACGFNSHSHLSKQFRQLTGMTPKVYRVGC
ncbi:AraC family transcriptional regulator [Halomicronema hongdechloris]|nr:AraC family transcriptional regulator [Halomicronema hongdechloris]